MALARSFLEALSCSDKACLVKLIGGGPLIEDGATADDELDAAPGFGGGVKMSKLSAVSFVRLTRGFTEDCPETAVKVLSELLLAWLRA